MKQQQMTCVNGWKLQMHTQTGNSVASSLLANTASLVQGQSSFR